MLKMFSTQVSGLFKRIQEQNEFALEDGARLLAQACIGDGTIYLCGIGEMAAVEAEAVRGAEPLPYVKNWDDIQVVKPEDRVLLFSRFSSDPEAVELAKNLAERGVPFVAASTVKGIAEGSNSGDMTDFADVHIDLKLPIGLLPDDTGNRVGYPGAMAGLFVYQALKFTLEEILADFA